MNHMKSIYRYGDAAKGKNKNNTYFQKRHESAKNFIFATNVVNIKTNLKSLGVETDARNNDLSIKKKW